MPPEQAFKLCNNESNESHEYLKKIESKERFAQSIEKKRSLENEQKILLNDCIYMEKVSDASDEDRLVQKDREGKLETTLRQGTFDK